jgi:hypothetical protein
VAAAVPSVTSRCSCSTTPAAIEHEEGEFTTRDGHLLVGFGEAFYSRNPDDGSVLALWEEQGRVVGRTYSSEGDLLAEHGVPGALLPDLN